MAAHEITNKRGVKSVKAELSDEQLKLKCVSDMITAYEDIVERNYIDKLVQWQKEQKQKTKCSKIDWINTCQIIVSHLKAATLF